MVASASGERRTESVAIYTYEPVIGVTAVCCWRRRWSISERPDQTSVGTNADGTGYDGVVGASVRLITRVSQVHILRPRRPTTT